MISVQPIAVTKPVVDFIPDSEGIISYTARVSNPSNQQNFETADKLLAYCAKHGHWSVFSMCNLVLEIKAPRDIGRQILRHQSADFQEFSQRYAEVTEDMFVIREARRQDEKNRQNSIPDVSVELRNEWAERQQMVVDMCREQYEWALRHKLAKECARVVLPEGNTLSSLYMNGTVRTWLHYIGLRQGNGTQAEHIEVALACRDAFIKYFPTLKETLDAI